MIKSKIIIYLILSLIVVLIPIVLLSRVEGIYWQDDLSFHLARLENYTSAIKQGIFFPKVFPDMAKGYGYAVDLFYPSILLFPYAILRVLGFSPVISFILFQVILTLVTYFIAYYSMLKISERKMTSLIFSLLYTCSTYRFIDQWIRGALSETMAFIFVPLIIYGMYILLHRRHNNVIPLVLGMTLLAYTHLLSVFMTSMLLLVWLLIVICKAGVDKIMIFNLFKAASLTILCSSFVIFPILEQLSYNKFYLSNSGHIWSIGLISLSDLINNSISSQVSIRGDIKPNVGILLFLGVIISLVRWNNINKEHKYVFMVCLAILFITTNLFPWNALINNKFLGVIQFPWRFLLFASFFLAWNFSLLIDDKFRFGFVILFLSFILSISSTYNYINNVKLNNSPVITNKDYMDFYRESIGAGKEYLPLSINYEEIKPFSEIAYDWKELGYNSWTFCLDMNEEAVVVLPKLAYVGYKLKNQNQDEIVLNNKSGLLSAMLPKGRNCYILSYSGTNIQIFSYILSIFGWFFILILSSGYFRKKLYYQTYN